MQYRKQPKVDYTGKTLISTSYMASDCYNQALVYVCGHDKDGAMGLIINKPIPNLTIASLLKKLRIMFTTDMHDISLLFGGPSEVTRGFILHSSDCMVEDSHHISGNVAITSTVDLLKTSLYETPPKHLLMCLGCVIWGQDDLEDQIAAHMWIPMQTDEDILFSHDHPSKWKRFLKTTGANSNILLDNTGYV